MRMTVTLGTNLKILYGFIANISLAHARLFFFWFFDFQENKRKILVSKSSISGGLENTSIDENSKFS